MIRRQEPTYPATHPHLNFVVDDMDHLVNAVTDTVNRPLQNIRNTLVGGVTAERLTMGLFHV